MWIPEEFQETLSISPDLFQPHVSLATGESKFSHQPIRAESRHSGHGVVKVFKYFWALLQMKHLNCECCERVKI